jgi:ribose transport system permease protein
VAGEKSNLLRIWGAAMFLYLLVALLNTFGIGMGLRLVLTGICIVAVITIGGGEKSR